MTHRIGPEIICDRVEESMRRDREAAKKPQQPIRDMQISAIMHADLVCDRVEQAIRQRMRLVDGKSR